MPPVLNQNAANGDYIIKGERPLESLSDLVLFERIGEFEQAGTHYRQAWEIDPGDAIDQLAAHQEARLSSCSRGGWLAGVEDPPSRLEAEELFHIGNTAERSAASGGRALLLTGADTVLVSRAPVMTPATRSKLTGACVTRPPRA